MRILNIITGLGNGGAEIALVRHCRSLRAVGTEIRVISLGAARGQGPHLAALGIDVTELALGRPFALIGSLRTIVSDFCPDLIHCWMYHPVLLAPLFAQGVPVVAGIRASLQSLSTERSGTKLVIHACALASRFAEVVVYNSQAAAQEHVAIGYSKARNTVIRNGFNTHDFNPDPARRHHMRERFGIGVDEIVIGHAARFHPVKNQLGLIEAFRLVPQSGKPVRLLMAGLMIDESNLALMNAIDASGRRDHISLLGPVTDIGDFMQTCDIYASSSIGEAFPNTVAEALAMAVPVVATDTGDTAQIVGSAGRIVPAGSATAFAAALGELIDLTFADRQALGRTGRRRVAECFSQSEATSAYLALYQSLINGHSGTHGKS